MSSGTAIGAEPSLAGPTTSSAIQIAWTTSAPDGWDMNEVRAGISAELYPSLKDRDSWWTVLAIDPLATRLLPTLARRPGITPMRLTTTAALLGVTSAILFAKGYLVAAAICFELRFFIDCLDGKLARLRGIASPRGAYFDFGCDVVLIGSNFAALGWFLVEERDMSLSLPLSVVVLSLMLFWFQVYHQWYPPPLATEAPGAGMLIPVRVGLFTRWRSWLARRRLVYAPRTVEVETLVLFIAPLTGRISVLTAAFSIALIYYTIATTRLAVLVYRHVPTTPATYDGSLSMD